MWTLDFEPKVTIWQATWGERAPGLYKKTLVGTAGLHQEAKCVWCEQLRSPRGELNVDHLRPKGRLTTWRGDPPEVADVPPKEELVNDIGYWWLAYTWANWNLACRDCNVTWKRNLLPRVDPHREHREGIEDHEVLLLVDPTSDFKTPEHFDWDEYGYMHGLSEIGRATIITCGLNRRELVAARSKVADDVLRATADFLATLSNGHEDAMHDAFTTLLHLGHESAEFAGMVRTLVEKRIGVSWEILAAK